MIRTPSGNSARIRVRARSSTSWTFTGPIRGGRWGVRRRSIRSCRRSASLMITCVYSRRSGRSNSRSRSWAEPRRPPSGFLISCARLRISARLATAWSSSRSSRSIRSRWSIERSSSTSRPGPVSTGVARQLRWSGGDPPRSSSSAWSEKPQLLAIAWRSLASNCLARAKRSGKRWPASCLAPTSRSCSAAGLTWTTRSSPSSTTTAVPRRSKPANAPWLTRRSPMVSRGFVHAPARVRAGERPTRCSAAGWLGGRSPHERGLPQARELFLERGDVAFVALDRLLIGLEAVEDALIILLVAEAQPLLLRELRLGVHEALLLGAELLLEDPAPVVVARLLRVLVDLRKVRWGRHGRARRRRRDDRH